MNMLKVLTDNKFFLFFVLLHLLLFNINAAEWGDSYRILRASKYIREFSYPEDEKRPPLFSIILSTYPDGIDPVVWGRGVMFAVSIASLLVFYKLTTLLTKNARVKDLSLLLFTLNPVYLYWSIRIMSDTFFALLVMAALYCYTRWKVSFRPHQLVILGLLSALAVLTRFEGYLLAAALFAGILLDTPLGLLKRRWKDLLTFTPTFLAVLIPYLIYKNPLDSKYFDEPSGRAYDIETVSVYVVSFLFLFGFTSAFFFVASRLNKVWPVLKGNVALSAFLSLELLLILLWPAAIPRLFTPVLPFLVMLLSILIVDYFEAGSTKKLWALIIPAGLLFIYVVSIFRFSLQFLVIVKYSFISILLLQIVNILAILAKRYRLFVYTLFLSALVWSLSVIWMHKDIFRVLNEAGEFAKTLPGRIAYNDVSAVTPWHLGDKGVYMELTNKGAATYSALAEKEIDYVLVTNEHNTNLKYDVGKRPYLTPVREFRDKTGGREFFTLIAKVER